MRMDGRNEELFYLLMFCISCKERHLDYFHKSEMLKVRKNYDEMLHTSTLYNNPSLIKSENLKYKFV